MSRYAWFGSVLHILLCTVLDSKEPGMKKVLRLLIPYSLSGRYIYENIEKLHCELSMHRGSNNTFAL